MRETVKRLRGPVGSSTKLKVQRDDSILHFEVKRAEYR
jgi:C-terminal processing protease CtpA/Prc